MRPRFNGRKTRLIYAGAGAVALAIPATAVALTAGQQSSPTVAANAPQASITASPTSRKTSGRSAFGEPRRTVRTAAQRGCDKLFTVNMGEGAANLIYSGTSPVTEHQLEVLGYIERCQRNPAAQGFVRGYDQYQAGMHRARIEAAQAAAAQAQAAQERQAASEEQHQSTSQREAQQQSTSQSEAQQSSSSSSASSSAQQSGGSGGYAIPSSVVQCESGGQNLPPNSAGASGYYQIIPSTWQAYGGGQYAASANEATPEQQAAVASKIWNGGAGASQWDCAG